MTFKKGDRIRHKMTKAEMVLHADQVGELIWAARAGMEAYPSTFNVESFEEIPRTPEKDQIWRMKGKFGATLNDYRILNVCGDWVIYELNDARHGELKYARTVNTFNERYEYVSG